MTDKKYRVGIVGLSGITSGVPAAPGPRAAWQGRKVGSPFDREIIVGHAACLALMDNVELAGTDQLAAELQQKRCDLLFRSISQCGRHIAEGQNVALRYVEGLEVGFRLQLLVKPPRLAECNVNHVFKELLTKQRPRTPETIRRCSFGAFDGCRATVEIRQLGNRRIEQVPGFLAERCLTMLGIAVKDEGTQCRDEEHLMRVPDQ